MGRAAELAAPDDQRVVEQAALLQVLHQGGGGLVGFRQSFSKSPEVRRGPPWLSQFVVELDEAHAALDQPAGEEAVVGEGGLAGFRAVEVERGLGSPERSISSGALVCMR
jgi:hypothetical protein